MAARDIPSTSPTVQSAPVSPSRTTSGSPPARVPMTGTPVASASSALRPNDSLWVGKATTNEVEFEIVDRDAEEEETERRLKDR